MQVKKLRYTNVIPAIFGAVLSTSVLMHSSETHAGGLQASTVLEKMDSAMKNAYFTGIVEGLAYARFVKEGKRADGGMKCIYDWYFETPDTITTILVAFRKFKNYRANAIIGALVARKCGE